MKNIDGKELCCKAASCVSVSEGKVSVLYIMTLCFRSSSCLGRVEKCHFSGFALIFSDLLEAALSPPEARCSVENLATEAAEV